MKKVVIVQARLTSTRMPGKVNHALGNMTILEHLIARCKKSNVDQVVVAAPHDFGFELSVPLFIGKEHDVLDRYYQCAKEYGAEIVVRVTADCPLLPPFEINRVVDELLASGFDYVTNRPAMPDGFDVEAFTFAALEKSWLYADDPYSREHVTPYIRNNEDMRKIFMDSVKLSVDTPEDLNRVKEWYELERENCTHHGRNGKLCKQFHQIPSGEPPTQSYSDIQP